MDIEQRELLREVVASEAWPAVLAFCEELMSKQAQRVLKVDLNKGSRELVIERAKLDGQRSMIKALTQAKQDLKGED